MANHEQKAVQFVVAGCALALLTACAGVEAKPTETHWAFTGPQRPSLPQVSTTEWPRNDIDRFVLKRIENAGLHPTAEADWRTLMRRVHFDLTGLPPTPAEIVAFERNLKSEPDSAFEKLVDRLLASPHFGEKWARWWMDLSHYGDSDGYLTDQLRPVAWRWRQWVVEAFNRNLPFDRFTVEQLAGDLLPNSTIQ